MVRTAIAIAAALASTIAFAQGRPVAQVAEEITRSVLTSGSERPLPLSASFLTGEPGFQSGEPNRPGYPTPNYQFGSNGWLKRGYHFLPTFVMPPPDANVANESFFRDALIEAQRLRLPLVFYGTQWESLLLKQPRVMNGDALWGTKPDNTPIILPGVDAHPELTQ